MPARRVFQGRADRVIACARLVLAAGAFLAFAFDPEPGHRSPFALYALFCGYFGWALVVLALGYRLSARQSCAIALHGIDLTVFTAACLLTEGPTSPFFLLFNFSILAAVLKWRWHGVLWTLVPVLALYLMAGLMFSAWLPGDFEPDRFVLRLAELLVAGILLGYFGSQQQRIFEEIARLTAAPLMLTEVASGADAMPPLRSVLSYVAGVFGAPRVLLAWADEEEPWLYVAHWRQGRIEQERLPPDALGALASKGFADRIFLTCRGNETLFLDKAGNVRRDRSIEPTLLRRYQVVSAISLPIRTEDLRGRIYVLDKPQPSPEDLSIAAVLAPRIEAIIEHAAAVQTAQKAMAAEDRVRVARDLHDGILQVLAGTALQLRALAAKAGLENDKTVATLQTWLLQEQRELRGFIAQLEPGAGSAPTGSIDLAATLKPLAETLHQQWGMDIEVTIDPPGAQFPAKLRFDLYQLVREAAANAARHGQATHLQVAVALEGASLRLVIEDNGCGFPAVGNNTSTPITEFAASPRSLNWRVKRLSGRLVTATGAPGAKVAIEIPIDRLPEWSPA